MSLKIDYKDDTAVVPKSSSVLVRRVPNLPNTPLLPQDKVKTQIPKVQAGSGAPNEPAEPSTAPEEKGKDEFGEDLFAEQKEEDAALARLLQQTGQQWENEVRQSGGRGRGRGRGRDFAGRSGLGRGRGHESAPAVLPKGYICYRCGQQGHHITACPTNADPDFKRIRPAIGIPSVLLQQKEGGGLLLPDGTLGSLKPNEDAFQREVGIMPSSTANAESTAQPSNSNAMVLYDDAGPQLAGGNEQAMPLTLPFLPPGTGEGPALTGEGPLLLPPGMPVQGDTPDGAPMSREEWELLQNQWKRKQARSRSKSRSRSPRRRRQYRDYSRSPRRRESPRRNYTRRRYML